MEDLVVCRPSCFWGGSENFFYINAFLELKSSSEAKAPGDGLQHCLDLWEYLRGILCVCVCAFFYFSGGGPTSGLPFSGVIFLADHFLGLANPHQLWVVGNPTNAIHWHLGSNLNPNASV